MDEQDLSPIAELYDRLADNLAQGDFDAIGEMYTEDAVILPPGPRTISGRAAIQRFWQQGRRLRELRFETTGVKRLGGNALRELGTLHIRVRGPGRPAREMSGKYVAVWQMIGGQWKLESSIWNGSGGNQARRRPVGPRGRGAGGGGRPDPAPYVPRVR